jgi:hypothetical protein
MDFRPRHCIENKCVDSRAFSMLPPYPRNIKSATIENATEEYYLQPEFYPTFLSDGFRSYINNSGGFEGFSGYGTYPSSDGIVVRNGEEINKTFYFFASWYVRGYQGVRLVYNITGDGEFDVKINPDMFLLAPTYPWFEKNWSQKVIINVKVRNASKGFYSINVDAVAPPPEIEANWSNYKLYSSAGSFGVGEPFYRLTLEVQ